MRRAVAIPRRPTRSSSTCERSSEAASRAPTVALALNRPAADVAAELSRHGIMCGGGDFYAVRALEAMGVDMDKGVLRLSFVHYTTEAEVTRLIAALDAVFGAVRAALDGIFNDKVFVVSFLSNVLVAAFIVFLGDQLCVGSQMSTGVVVILGVRIFSNVASIRRHLFKA